MVRWFAGSLVGWFGNLKECGAAAPRGLWRFRHPAPGTVVPDGAQRRSGTFSPDGTAPGCSQPSLRGLAPTSAVASSTSQNRFRPGPLRGVLRWFVEAFVSSAAWGAARVGVLDQSKAVPAGLLRRHLRRVTFFLREKSNQKTRLKDAVWRLRTWSLWGLQNSDYDVVRARLDSPGLRPRPEVALVWLRGLRMTRHRALRARRLSGGQSPATGKPWLRQPKPGSSRSCRSRAVYAKVLLLPPENQTGSEQRRSRNSGATIIPTPAAHPASFKSPFAYFFGN
jgi:hypothetical protein